VKSKAHIWLAVALTACNASVPDQKIQYTWLSEHRSLCFPDTITSLPKHNENDYLVGRISFTYCEGEHTMTGWTDGRDAPVDGESFWLELDSIGTIFSVNTTMPGCAVVHSNNDSINQLIAMALAAASRPGNRGLRYPQLAEPKIETVDFTQLEVHDTTDTRPK